MTKSSEGNSGNSLMQRSITGALFACAVAGCLLWRFESFAAIFVVIALLAAYEWVYLSSLIAKTNTINLTDVCLLGIPFTFASLSLWFYANSWFMGMMLCIPLLLVSISIFKKNVSKNFIYPALLLSGFLLVSVPFCLTLILAPGFTHGIYSWKILLPVTTMVWTHDTMAYLSGMLFGKSKLAPLISPKKTWEGFTGGVAFTALAAWIWSQYLDRDAVTWILMGICIAVSATAGDLCESMLKRSAGVKDSGNWLPGHGGMLDRFDGFLGAMPVVVLFYLLTGL